MKYPLLMFACLLLSLTSWGQYEILMYDGKVMKTSRLVEGSGDISFEQLIGEKKFRANFKTEGVFEVSKNGKVLHNFYQPEDPEVELNTAQMRQYIYGKRDGLLKEEGKAAKWARIGGGFVVGFAYPSTYTVLGVPLMSLGMAAVIPVNYKGDKERKFYKVGYKQAVRKRRMRRYLVQTFIGSLGGVILGNVIQL